MCRLAKELRERPRRTPSRSARNCRTRFSPTVKPTVLHRHGDRQPDQETPPTPVEVPGQKAAGQLEVVGAAELRHFDNDGQFTGVLAGLRDLAEQFPLFRGDPPVACGEPREDRQDAEALQVGRAGVQRAEIGGRRPIGRRVRRAAPVIGGAADALVASGGNPAKLMPATLLDRSRLAKGKIPVRSTGAGGSDGCRYVPRDQNRHFGLSDSARASSISRMRLADELRVLGGEVLLFPGIGLQVVQLGMRGPGGRSLVADGLPVAHAQRLAAALRVVFPIEILVRLLIGRVAEQGGGEAQSVAILRRRGAAVISASVGQTSQNAADLVRLRPGHDMARPAGDERNPNAAFVNVLLQPAKSVGGMEVRRVGAADADRRAVVAREQHQGVLVQVEFAEHAMIRPT